jgi:hypothetical protein
VNGFDVRLGCLPREKFEGFLGREKSEGVGSGGSVFTPSPPPLSGSSLREKKHAMA